MVVGGGKCVSCGESYQPLRMDICVNGVSKKRDNFPDRFDENLIQE